ncbi:MAG: hypothetical protein IJC50_05285 [Clostridia bacterium]|nr:hypothetical protein [Clostridia bacterium]
MNTYRITSYEPENIYEKFWAQDKSVAEKLYSESIKRLMKINGVDSFDFINPWKTSDDIEKFVGKLYPEWIADVDFDIVGFLYEFVKGKRIAESDIDGIIKLVLRNALFGRMRSEKLEFDLCVYGVLCTCGNVLTADMLPEGTFLSDMNGDFSFLSEIYKDFEVVFFPEEEYIRAKILAENEKDIFVGFDLGDIGTPYYLGFTFNHWHLSSEKELVEYIDEIIADKRMSIEFFVGLRPQMGGDLTSDDLSNLSFESLCDRFPSCKNNSFGLNFKIRSFSGKYDIDAHFERVGKKFKIVYDKK